jgi:DUF1680 family protein
MVLLYRLTGEQKYRDFCEYILRAWEKPNGPHIVSRLLSKQGVNRVGNGKAYEMLSCLNGLLEWYRTTGDRKCFDAVVLAWEDITSKRIYLTGSVSVQDFFGDDYWLPNPEGTYHAPGAGGSETCDTITWLQLNAQLLRLTDEARYAEQIERVLYNHVLGAQSPDGAAWGPLVPLDGHKSYTQDTCCCCLSSGPRGLALTPTFAWTTDNDGIVVNLYEAGKAQLTLRNGSHVHIAMQTNYPASGDVSLRIDPAVAAEFVVKLRIPKWCDPKSASLRVNDQPQTIAIQPDGYAIVRRRWNPGDAIFLMLPEKVRVVIGDHSNQRKLAFVYGPLVLAADESLLGDKVSRLTDVVVTADPDKLTVSPEPAPTGFQTWAHAQVFRLNTDKGVIRLVPFADAGSKDGKAYRVWLPRVRTPSAFSGH